MAGSAASASSIGGDSKSTPSAGSSGGAVSGPLTIGLFTYSGYAKCCEDDLHLASVSAKPKLVPLLWHDATPLSLMQLPNASPATATALTTEAGAAAKTAEPTSVEHRQTYWPTAAPAASAGANGPVALPPSEGASTGAAGAGSPIAVPPYDLLIIRSTWDYTERYGEFRKWLESLASHSALQARVCNPISVVLWNSVKHQYLPELAAAGITVADTVWLDPAAMSTEQLSKVSVEQILTERKWSRAVIKPGISASSDNTRVTANPTANSTASDAAGLTKARAEDTAFLQHLLKEGRVMAVQEFLPEVVSPGEWSLVHFDGVFSHATLKSPSNIDKHALWTKSKPAIPPKHVLDFAQKVLNHIPKPKPKPKSNSQPNPSAATATATAPATAATEDPALQQPLRESCLYARVDMVDRSTAQSGSGAGSVLLMVCAVHASVLLSRAGPNFISFSCFLIERSLIRCLAVTHRNWN